MREKLAKKLFQVVVPTRYGDTLKPISTKHHKNWDKYVRSISNGLTILSPAKGQWIHEQSLFEERVIPVLIMCTEKEINNIVQFTLRHYRQKAVMYFVVSSDCRLEYAKEIK